MPETVTIYEDQPDWIHKKRDPRQPDMSAARDDAMVQLLVDFDDLVAAGEFIPGDQTDPAPEAIAVKDFQGTRIGLAKTNTPQMWIAQGTVQRPVLVTRDYLRSDENGTENTYVLHYIGIARTADGTPVLSYVQCHKNVGIRAIVAPASQPDAVLWEVSGVPIYQKKVNEI